MTRPTHEEWKEFFLSVTKNHSRIPLFGVPGPIAWTSSKGGHYHSTLAEIQAASDALKNKELIAKQVQVQVGEHIKRACGAGPLSGHMELSKAHTVLDNPADVALPTLYAATRKKKTDPGYLPHKRVGRNVLVLFTDVERWSQYYLAHTKRHTRRANRSPQEGLTALSRRIRKTP